MVTDVTVRVASLSTFLLGVASVGLLGTQRDSQNNAGQSVVAALTLHLSDTTLVWTSLVSICLTLLAFLLGQNRAVWNGRHALSWIIISNFLTLVSLGQLIRAAVCDTGVEMESFSSGCGSTTRMWLSIGLFVVVALTVHANIQVLRARQASQDPVDPDKGILHTTIITCTLGASIIAMGSSLGDTAATAVPSALGAIAVGAAFPLAVARRASTNTLLRVELICIALCLILSALGLMVSNHVTGDHTIQAVCAWIGVSLSVATAGVELQRSRQASNTKNDARGPTATPTTPHHREVNARPSILKRKSSMVAKPGVVRSQFLLDTDEPKLFVQVSTVAAPFLVRTAQEITSRRDEAKRHGMLAGTSSSRTTGSGSLSEVEVVTVPMPVGVVKPPIHLAEPVEGTVFPSIRHSRASRASRSTSGDANKVSVETSQAENEAVLDDETGTLEISPPGPLPTVMEGTSRATVGASDGSDAASVDSTKALSAAVPVPKATALAPPPSSIAAPIMKGESDTVIMDDGRVELFAARHGTPGSSTRGLSDIAKEMKKEASRALQKLAQVMTPLDDGFCDEAANNNEKTKFLLVQALVKGEKGLKLLENKVTMLKVAASHAEAVGSALAVELRFVPSAVDVITREHKERIGELCGADDHGWLTTEQQKQHQPPPKSTIAEIPEHPSFGKLHVASKSKLVTAAKSARFQLPAGGGHDQMIAFPRQGSPGTSQRSSADSKASATTDDISRSSSRRASEVLRHSLGLRGRGGVEDEERERGLKSVGSVTHMKRQLTSLGVSVRNMQGTVGTRMQTATLADAPVALYSELTADGVGRLGRILTHEDSRLLKEARILRLRGLHLTYDACIQLAYRVKVMPNLAELDLRGNMLDSLGASTIVFMLRKHPTLDTINLGGSSLSDVCKQMIRNAAAVARRGAKGGGQTPEQPNSKLSLAPAARPKLGAIGQVSVRDFNRGQGGPITQPLIKNVGSAAMNRQQSSYLKQFARGGSVMSIRTGHRASYLEEVSSDEESDEEPDERNTQFMEIVAFYQKNANEAQVERVSRASRTSRHSRADRASRVSRVELPDDFTGLVAADSPLADSPAPSPDANLPVITMSPSRTKAQQLPESVQVGTAEGAVISTFATLQGLSTSPRQGPQAGLMAPLSDASSGETPTASPSV